MKVWNVTDKKTPELERLGFLNIQCQVGETTLKPGESMEVDVHLRAEIAPLLRQGILSETDPTPPPPPPEKKAEETKGEAPSAEEAKPESAPAPSESRQGRKPRGE